MKTLIIAVIIVLALAGLWYYTANQSSLFEQEGKTARGKRGVVEVPVTASGEAIERQRIEIKAEASGTVMEVLVDEGDLVQPGQPLLRLDEEQENRNLEIAKASEFQSQQNLDISKLAFEQAKTDKDLNIQQAETQRDIAQAEYDYALAEYKIYEKLSHEAQTNNREFLRAKSAMLQAQGTLAMREKDLEKIKLDGPRNILWKESELKLAESRLKSAELNRKDAEKRLRDTTVKNNYPSACRVVRIYVSKGYVVNSAIGIVGGGTPLMELADTSAVEVLARVDESDIDKVQRMLIEGRAERDADPEKAKARLKPTATFGASVEGAAEPEAVEGLDQPAEKEQAGHESPLTFDEWQPTFSDEVLVTFDALTRESFTGRIMEISQKPVTVSQIITYEVRLRLDEQPNLLRVRLGMQGNANFAPLRQEGLCIPYEAVSKMGRRYVVRLPDPKNPRGEPIEHEVEVGLTDGEKVVILSGLDEQTEFYIKLPVRIQRAGN